MNLTPRVVTTPDGAQWQVARVWTERKMPSWRKISLDGGGFEWLAPDSAAESPIAWLALVIATIVALVVLIPLLLFGLELLLLGILVAAAILVRTLHRRPWLVRARPVAGGGSELAWRVVGWRRSRRVIEEVAATLSGGATPQPLEPVERVLNRVPELA